jgi:hypothetical protein
LALALRILPPPRPPILYIVRGWYHGANALAFLAFTFSVLAAPRTVLSRSPSVRPTCRRAGDYDDDVRVRVLVLPAATSLGLAAVTSHHCSAAGRRRRPPEQPDHRHAGRGFTGVRELGLTWRGPNQRFCFSPCRFHRTAEKHSVPRVSVGRWARRRRLRRRAACCLPLLRARLAYLLLCQRFAGGGSSSPLHGMGNAKLRTGPSLPAQPCCGAR